jgi:hypothetical protein
MMVGKACKLYRDSTSLQMGRGIGYCDIDCVSTICDGDVRFCERLDILEQYLVKEKKDRYHPLTVSFPLTGESSFKGGGR